MLMDGMGQEVASVTNDSDKELIYTVHSDPVMTTALNVLEKIGKKNKVILQAKGTSIPYAVSVANIITEKMLKDNSTVQKITVDSENPPGIGRMTSTIEIIITKNS